MICLEMQGETEETLLIYANGAVDNLTNLLPLQLKQFPLVLLHSEVL